MALKTCTLAHSIWLAAVTLATPAAVHAQEEPPAGAGRSWRLVLEQQLRAEKTCDLMEVLLYDEFEREGETVLEGKISCVDGRLFDFVRRHEHQKFELDLCEPAVC